MTHKFVFTLISLVGKFPNYKVKLRWIVKYTEYINFIPIDAVRAEKSLDIDWTVTALPVPPISYFHLTSLTLDSHPTTTTGNAFLQTAAH